jgi:hypothetical protein
MVNSDNCQSHDNPDEPPLRRFVINTSTYDQNFQKYRDLYIGIPVSAVLFTVIKC